MKSNWQRVPLSEVADLTVGFVGTMAKHYVEQGIPFLRSTNISPFKIDLSDIKYISPIFNKKILKSQLNTDDVVIVRTGKPGACAVIPEKNEPWNCSDLVIIRPNKTKVLPLYLASYINLAYGVINSQVVGAVQQHFNVGSAKNLIIELPPIEDQEKICSIISSIIEKMETNMKINDHLQQQVFAIYDSWFVAFDRTGGVMPSEWCEATLNDIATVTSGKRPPMKQTSSTADVQIPLVGAASVMGYTNTVLYNEPILVTGRVGTHGIVQRFQIPCWTSDNTLVIKSKFYEFVYQILQRIDYDNLNRGSTQPLITQTDLKKVNIVLPSNLDVCEFEELAGTLMLMYEANRKENEQLAVLRDTLLPKLISGEIDISAINI